MKRDSLSTTPAFGGAMGGKRLRGAFVNTAEANCSIFESGRMVYRCIGESPFYDLDYFTLGNLDIDLFHREGVLRTLDGFGPPDVEYDFYVFNWHFITMASDVQPDAIKRLKAPKFTVVLELAPGNPLELVPPGVFDGFIALDPSAHEQDGIFAFPRPLEEDPWTGDRPNNDVPVIASFGFGTPGKGFELLVEAVNREFDHAVVRINVPNGTYVFTELIHGMPYAARLGEVCRKIAKPGIEVRFTNDYMTPEELIAWCAGNDLNCFMYTRAQPGLSATTDQSIISGQPLLTLTNDTFRHIHRYIPPYPLVGLREAIAASVSPIRDIQVDWSREAFRDRFHGMLGRAGLLDAASTTVQLRAPPLQMEQALVFSPGGAEPGNCLSYAQKIVDSLGRSGTRRILHLAYEDTAGLSGIIESARPDACILVDVTDGEREFIGRIIDRVDGPKLLITSEPDGLRAVLGSESSNLLILPRQPIIPFHTTYVALREPQSVWLVGFGSQLARLEDVLGKLRRELSHADVIVEVPDVDFPVVSSRIRALGIWQAQDAQFRLSVEALPAGAEDVINCFAGSSLIVVNNDPTRTQELEALACVAMVTERPVVFTRHGPFPRFLGRGTFIEDHTIPDLMALGVAAQIKAYYDFGEWTFAAAISRLLDGSWRSAVPEAAADAVVALTGMQMLQIAAIGTGATVEPPIPVAAPPKPIPLGDSATILRPRGSGSTVFVLAGLIEHGVTRPSTFIVSLVDTWRARGEPVRIVLWNTETKRLHLLSEDQWREVSGPTDAARWPVPVGAGNSPVLVDPASCGPQDWLVVPEAFHTRPGAHPLLAMTLLLEARRLKLGSAFIFHGAEPLASPAADAVAVEDHLLYMQGLLLADVVLPGAATAAEDLHDLLVEYELAAFIPRIRTVPRPADDRFRSPEAWPTYVRALRAVLSDAADPVRHLASIYYLVDAQGAAPWAGFAAVLAEALMARGLGLVPVGWDADAGALVPVAPPGPGDWAAWVAPGAVGAPGWLLAATPIAGRDLDRITQMAHGAGLRVAGLLTHHRPQSGASVSWEADAAALAKLDKVLAGSKSQFDDFYRFLLASPDRVPAAEDRFKIVELPTERSATPQRSAPKRAAASVIRAIIFVATPDASDLHALFAAATRALRLSPVRVKFTFVSLLPEDGHLASDALRAALAAVPGAQWTCGLSAERLDDLLRQTDFAVYSGSAGHAAEEVAEALWQGVPCLVLQTASAAAFQGLGVAVAGLRDTEAAARAILALTDPEWRRALANEALSRPVRTWRDYADDVAAALATDRLLDRVSPAQPSGRTPVLGRFPNLRPRPKLSLCISTYNRGGWVGVNLRNIFSQIPVPRADLEVLVVDNTSTDNTPEIVQPFFARPDFRYVRNPKNVGLLGNLAVTAQRARGDYIWILGDDDLTRPGTIERVIAIINERPKIDLIYMNYGYSSEKDPGNVTDLDAYLTTFNYLEPAGPDEVSTVKLMAAKSENFYTAIYSHVYRRDHGMRAYCQDTTDRIFSTMLSCIPTSYYTMHYMPDATVYWMGEPALVVNSNVSWQAYGTLFDLEQLPRTWDLAERIGCPADEVDRRRSNRLWLVELMWREMFEDDRAGNASYFSAPRVLMRLKHLEAFRKHVPTLKDIYVKAYRAGHPAAEMDPDTLFSFPW